MTQLLESTRNYLKSSTKLGRRMNSRDETSGSETSLPSSTHSNNLPPKTILSSIFEPETARSKSPIPEDNSLTYDTALLPNQEKDYKNDIEPTLKYSKTLPRTKSRGKNVIHNQDRDNASEHMEEVPRGRSPTLSMSNTISTAASSYEIRPTDYPNMQQYQAHVWRRTLLEESIMHSLRLGYSDCRRPSRHQSYSSRKGSRNHKARDIAILTAAMGKEGEASSATQQENIIDRSLKIIEKKNRAHNKAQPPPPKNSPYPVIYNYSMTNITESFASFTLELPDHHANHIMASSAIPNLFKIKKTIPATFPYRSRSRQNSRASLHSITPSTRVLNGKKPTVSLPKTTLPDVQDEVEESESPLTPNSVIWADSLYNSLDKVASTSDLRVDTPAPSA
ncbi:hypothetical protein BGZ49_010259 [Haplosporangium sp. Z 27]|nr:hypothetical protein BGZ49_010259 [Haplosporangium sp. Z 27]